MKNLNIFYDFSLSQHPPTSTHLLRKSFKKFWFNLSTFIHHLKRHFSLHKSNKLHEKAIKIPQDSKPFPSSILMKDSPRRCKKGSKGHSSTHNRESTVNLLRFLIHQERSTINSILNQQWKWKIGNVPVIGPDLNVSMFRFPFNFFSARPTRKDDPFSPEFHRSMFNQQTKILARD